MSFLCRHRGKAQVQLDPICNLGARRVWLVSTTTRLHYPQERPGTHYRRLGGPRGRSGQARKISPTNGIRTPQIQTHSESPQRPHYRGRPLLSRSGHETVGHAVRSALLGVENCRSRRIRHGAGICVWELRMTRILRTRCVSATELTHFLFQPKSINAVNNGSLALAHSGPNILQRRV